MFPKTHITKSIGITNDTVHYHQGGSPAMGMFGLIFGFDTFAGSAFLGNPRKGTPEGCFKMLNEFFKIHFHLLF